MKIIRLTYSNELAEDGDSYYQVTLILEPQGESNKDIEKFTDALMIDMKKSLDNDYGIVADDMYHEFTDHHYKIQNIQIHFMLSMGIPKDALLKEFQNILTKLSQKTLRQKSSSALTSPSSQIIIESKETSDDTDWFSQIDNAITQSVKPANAMLSNSSSALQKSPSSPMLPFASKQTTSMYASDPDLEEALKKSLVEFNETKYQDVHTPKVDHYGKLEKEEYALQAKLKEIRHWNKQTLLELHDTQSLLSATKDPTQKVFKPKIGGQLSIQALLKDYMQEVQRSIDLPNMIYTMLEPELTSLGNNIGQFITINFKIHMVGAEKIISPNLLSALMLSNQGLNPFLCEFSYLKSIVEFLNAQQCKTTVLLAPEVAIRVEFDRKQTLPPEHQIQLVTEKFTDHPYYQAMRSYIFFNDKPNDVKKSNSLHDLFLGYLFEALIHIQQYREMAARITDEPARIML